MQSACSFFCSLARINRTEETKRALHERYTDTRHPFLCMVLRVCFCSLVPKSNLPYTRGITPKRVTSGGAHLRCLAPGQHSPEEISQRWRAVVDTVPIEPQTYRTDGVGLTTELTGRCGHVRPEEKELDCFTRKASKGKFLLLVAWAYFLFAASMRPTKTL